VDQARFGLLFLRKGNWKGKQLISGQWIDAVQKTSAANVSYGYMWWLNRGNGKIEGVGEAVYSAAGFGGNYIVVDREHDLLIVIRWLEPKELGKIMDAVN
jgi:CubicO group peptidase (beta-lactamase class C family)